MSGSENSTTYKSGLEKFLALSLESTRKSYYPQLQAHIDVLKENQRRLNLLIDNVPARIGYVDSNERFVFVNRNYEKAFGKKRGHIIGKSVETLVGPDNYLRLTPYIQSALKGKQVHFEMSFPIPGGETQWIAVDYVPDVSPGGKVIGYFSMVLDLSEKKRAQEEKAQLESKLQQAQKFEAIGTLAGGIAHDFNNLLMGIQGRMSLLSVDLDAPAPIMEHVSAIEEYIRSAAALTKQLLGFARGGKYEVKPININDLLTSSASMFGRTRKEIRIRTRLASSLLIVEADQQQIEQVLLNMYVNAWQAMPDGGDLYLESKRVSLDEAYCRPHNIAVGQYARLSVTDTGIGMDAATCQKVFDPFFTTKQKGRGTGLGLASAYGIVKNHDGIITVYSEVGHGTTFNIYLPVSHRDLVQEPHQTQELVKGTETILLVDDEKMIIDVARSMLEKLGYRVVVANGGQQAIDRFSEMVDEIDLVILDMIMPGMDGGKVFDRIREMRADMPVLLSSGYAINGQAEKIIKKGCNGFIQKPFNLTEISHQIRTILQ